MDPIRIYNRKTLKEVRQDLRATATPAEKILWQYLNKYKLGVRFHRQYGVYKSIIDFYCPKLKLGIELDGQQHKKKKEFDDYRSMFMSALGIRIIRFWNYQVINNPEVVVDVIKQNILSLSPSLIKEGDIPACRQAGGRGEEVPGKSDIL